MTLPRADLAKLFPGNPRAVLHFDAQQQQVAANAQAVAANVADTVGIQNATVLSLSKNDALTNERVLEVGPGLSFKDEGPGEAFTLLLAYLIVLQGGYDCTFNLLADTTLTLPTSGTLLTTDYLSDGPYASDAAAAAGGVPVGGVYRATGGAMKWRQV